MGEAEAPTEPQGGQAEGQQAQTQQQQAEAQQVWWRRDGSIPGGVLQLPVSEAPPAEAMNSLSKDMQQLLR